MSSSSSSSSSGGSGSNDGKVPADLITPKEAARLVGCHVATIYRWVLSGRLGGWRRQVGQRYLVSRAEALALARPVPVPPPPPLPEAPRTRAEQEAGALAAIERLRREGFRV